MKILLTGATGYVGARVARSLIARGDTVIGVVRDDTRVPALTPGVVPLVADLSEVDRIVDAATGTDVVLHAGFAAHGVDWFAAVEIERALVAGLSHALAGSRTRLIVSNGTAFYGDVGETLVDETVAVPDGPTAVRWRATVPATQTPGLDGVELRLASFVHGHGGSIFVPALVDVARRTGRSIYVGEGDNQLSAVHVDGAARAYVVATTRGQGVYHVASDERLTMRVLAEGIAVGTGARAESVTGEEAAALTDPFTAMFLALNNGLNAEKAKRELGWSAGGDPDLIWDVREGSYAGPGGA